jgi:hypothetical protein
MSTPELQACLQAPRVRPYFTNVCRYVTGFQEEASEGAEDETMGRRRNSGFRYDRRKAFQIGRVVMATLLIILLVLILVRLVQ